MSITRLQQARQMYAMGQRVAKTLDGSRPGYRGDDAYGGGRSSGSSSNSSGPAGGASAGGNYGGDSSGGTSANNMSNTRNEGPAGSRPGNNNTVDPGFQNALRNQQVRQNTITQSQNPNYGQFFGSRVPTYQAPTLGQRIGSGISNVGDMFGNYIKSGGMLGMAGRGLGSLLEGIFGPSVPSTGNVGPAGIKTDGTYGTVEDAIRASQRNERPVDIGGDNNTYIPPLYAENETIEDVDGDGIISLQDIVLRFQGADRTLNPEAAGFQDTDKLRAAIMERAKNLYT